MHSSPRRLDGDKVRQLRTERGEYHRAFARRAGVNWRYLYDIQAGKKQPSNTIIGRLAVALDVTIDDISDPVTEAVAS